MIYTDEHFVNLLVRTLSVLP